QLAPLGKQRDETAIVEPECLAHDQQREQLRLGEVMPRKPVGITWQRGAPHLECLARQLQRRLGHGTHLTPPAPPTRGSTERRRAALRFQQSKSSTTRPAAPRTTASTSASSWV